MYSIDPTALRMAITDNVTRALTEDIGDGDINAALIQADSLAEATIITRQDAVFCGRAWADEVFRQIDPTVRLDWKLADGDRMTASDTLVTISGSARALLSGERTALNFLQLLSGTATRTDGFARQVADTGVQLLDTRKTLPGLRQAQKYAVSCGGGHNHRMGLYDAFLIKENHIAACGGLAQAVEAARKLAPGKLVEVETETLDELEQALAAGADVIMLDNFSIEDTSIAVNRSRGKARIEASGGINNDTLTAIAATGVDFISMGSLTKDVTAIDLSMRLQLTNDRA
ncbi:carboxylating nicotinate-nucleotide diphosphorylase [Marinobacterium aestuariivivens]|uniref:nicotinate-nucleotide diphosphorylase (carboxylating) n=1 Tax=Marinobacterium aestuariivivens TaxID=1698799 RepID=A0ABW2A9P7_9GAMM